MTSNSSVPAVGKVEMVFNQVDDHVKVNINGNEFSQGLLHHGQGPVSKDITPYLKEGKNRIEVKVTNGLGWATFIASLNDNSTVLHQWHNVNAAADKNDVFLWEVIYIYYRDGHAVSSTGQGFWAHISQADDHLTIDINNGQKVFKHGLTHHGDGATVYNLTPYMQKGRNTVKFSLFNGPAFAVLKGSITVGPTADGEYVTGWEFQEAAGAKNEVVFEETYEFDLE